MFELIAFKEKKLNGKK